MFVWNSLSFSVIQWMLDYRKSKRISENHLLLLIGYAKVFECVDQTNWKILQDLGMPGHLTCLLRNLHIKKQKLESDMEKRTGSKLEKECFKTPCLFNLYAEYITWTAWLDEAQTGIKIVGRNINNIRYADDTTLMAENEEELKSVLMKVKDKHRNAGLKLNNQKTNIPASSSITSWKIEVGKWKQWQTLFSWTPKSLWTVTGGMKLKDACSLEEKLWQT